MSMCIISILGHFLGRARGALAGGAIFPAES